ncbi:MAG TPA: 1,4-dihydroxy-2-naphthoate polyprenyltransferase [Candidatus Omnitrophica bacterium]|nr:MAG: 1,4-dihydroxy-2-naphthoate octaprenyltransferase [Omnitrophica WOR_2 bacterium GWA2_45_18]OGX18338.1 MAG: 1,4-dihydroxy-2-naphthoate octaprenyltransferase [Omnitrophica WOR_2 bacterium GWC2_45_7]HBR14035.1 1,4-dihydroxy-2-naphthoate polyprenyltransferase [Candidatus Omnitrophota bacterium]
MAIRPKTLMAALSPVMIGTAMAFGDGVSHFPTAFLCLAGALLIQIGTNLANDYFDFKKGADTHERLGPTRVTQAGLISPGIIKWAFILTFALAALISTRLIERGGWPILVIGVLSIVSGILYTAGPWALGYMGLGDLFVLIFFGPVAVAGTYYVQSHEINNAVILAGLAPGLISVGILTINNLRDKDSDQSSGKKTLAVRFGKSFAQMEYLIAILTAAVIPVFIYIYIEDHIWILACVIISLLAVPAFKTVLTKSDGPSLNLALAFTGELLFIYSLLFSLGWVL